MSGGSRESEEHSGCMGGEWGDEETEDARVRACFKMDLGILFVDLCGLNSRVLKYVSSCLLACRAFTFRFYELGCKKARHVLRSQGCC